MSVHICQTTRYHIHAESNSPTIKYHIRKCSEVVWFLQLDWHAKAESHIFATFFLWTHLKGSQSESQGKYVCWLTHYNLQLITLHTILKTFQSLKSTHYVFKALILILTHLSSQSTQPNGSSSEGPLLWRRFVTLSPRPNNLAMGCVSNGLLQLSPGDPAEGLLHTNICKYEHKKNVLDITGMILCSHPLTKCATLTEMYFYLWSCYITLKMARLCDCASLIHLDMNVQKYSYRTSYVH
jgi:hypothetical protein